MVLDSLFVNNQVYSSDLGINEFKEDSSFLTYYIENSDSIEVRLICDPQENLEFVMTESAFDLFEQPLINAVARDPHMMPKPFVINDATMVKKKFSF